MERNEKLAYQDENLEIEFRVKDLLSRLTLEEKLSLLSGKKLFWTKSIKRLGIPSLKMTDGPHGIGGFAVRFAGKMSYFPVATCRTATWNTHLSEQFGVALAKEAKSIGRSIVLAPGINIQRTPLCGRNFEYQTEDPFLNKILAVKVVKGIQSQGIAACAKHYAANNQEFNRFKVNSKISERALREIYLPAFEATVKEANVWSVMACYNRINEEYGCENHDLLVDKLVKEWDFRGFVMSDWFATRFTNTVKCIKAGLSLEMPGNVKMIPKNQAFCYHPKKLKRALDMGFLEERHIDNNLMRLLRVMFLVGFLEERNIDFEKYRNAPEHQILARKIAQEGMVLLKNECDLLPLNINEIKKISILGPNAKKKMASGGGSSSVNALYEITPYKGLKLKCKGKIKIISSVEKSDVSVICVGLNHKKFNDYENKDRLYLELPLEQEQLIKETVKKNPNAIVILISGSPVAMDNWINEVPAVIQAWYAGMEGGMALADIIFGDVSPSGKLPITFPRKLSDSPAHASLLSYPGIKDWNKLKEGDLSIKKDEFRIKYAYDDVLYEEGIFVGYRHFDINNIEPLFCFGHGLSYTTFEYSNLSISREVINQKDAFSISLDLCNTGNRRGAEVVQLYVQDVESSVQRPIKELKGFQKIMLEPSEYKKITFELHPADLSFYDENSKSWKVEPGEFKILLGSSSRDIRLTEAIKVSD
ncbi:MAG: glycoside hydrolase family 3 C-terminal domain-containing protein [Candidatus Lokiarchaeota archaeon]|nr:glycoside hydrolase family 3 C-terminal domain-containing protein [Candidatus Lokiarchaeota archaeon]